MTIEQVAAGDMADGALVVERPSSPAASLNRIFESEEIGLFRIALADRQRVPVGDEEVTVLVLCLSGEIALSADDRDVVLPQGSYAVVPEGEAGEIAGSDGDAEALLFFGLEQLPGAFFNSYGSANVQDR